MNSLQTQAQRQRFPGDGNSFSFEQKFQLAQKFVGAKVCIQGKPHGTVDKGETGVCTGVVKTYGHDCVDFILENGHRFGVQLEVVTDNACVGRTQTFSNFVRTVTRVMPGSATPAKRVRG